MRSTSKLLALVLAALVLLLLAWFGFSRSDRSDPAVAVAPALHSKDDALALRMPPVGLAEFGTATEARGEAPDPGVERVAGEIPGAVLRGRIEGLESPHTYDEVRVALWPERTKPNCVQFAVAGPHTKVLRVVRAASDGTFSFEGLDPDARYELRAGGALQASLALEEPVAPSEGAVTLVLARVKGLRIEFVGPDGEPPRSLPWLVERGVEFSGSAIGGHGVELEPWEQELAGVPGVGCAAEVPAFVKQLVLSGPAQYHSIGPITSYAEIPGYVVEQPTFWAPVVVDRLPIEKVVLRPATAGWSTLELELTGPGEAIRAQLSESDLLGEIWMAYEDGPEFSLPVLGLAAMRRYEGIPHGELRWGFRSDRGFVWPRDGGSIPLRIGAEPARAILDLSEAGGLLVRFDTPERPDPLPFTHMSIAHEGGKTQESIPANRLPFYLLLIEPGEWRQSSLGILVKETEVYYMRKQKDGPAVRVEPGALTTLELSSAPASYLPTAR